MQILKKILCVLLLVVLNPIIQAEVFVIRHIKVTGLQRISLGTVLSYLPIREGDRIDNEQTGDIIRALYQKTNFFSDITLQREHNDLIIHVVERPVISFMTINGNKKLAKNHLLDALKSVGIAEGQALDQAVLNSVQHAIIQQYYNMGMYNPKVDVMVNRLPRNCVSLTVNINEGPTAKIKLIKIEGNHSFSTRTLLGEFSLATTKPWSFLTGTDQYSKEKLDVDLEKLRSYYMNHGFVRMRVDDTKVTITPNKKSIHIVVKIIEGGVYKLKGFTLEGDLLSKRAEVRNLIGLQAGTIFSLKDVIVGQTKVSEFLGDLGYGRSEVNYDIDVNDSLRTVQVKYVVVPGHRVYIRHIDFTGNTSTREEVLRREMRMQEGGLFSFSKISESRRRLANLSYLQDIDTKVVPVTVTNNQVDLLYDVKEVSAVNFNLQGGYSDREGFIYAADVQNPNFLGTGKSVSVMFNNSRATQNYGFGYRDPYFTQDKIGFSVNGYARKVDPNKISSELSSYSSSTYGLFTGFDVPLSDYTQIDFGFGVEHISLSRATNSHSTVEAFLNKYGTSFNQFKVNVGWSYSNLDKAVLPTRGFKQVLGADIYGPLNSRSLEFYRLDYITGWYIPLFKDFILHTNTQVGYGNGFGKTDKLPPFKNFFAGGIDSIRGFDSDSICNDESRQNTVIGGNFLALARVDLIIPAPMKDTLRPSIFWDVGSVWDIGNIYDKSLKLSDVRMSCGLQIEWRTPLVPLKFSFSKPLRKKSWDHLDAFQFSLGFTLF